MSYDKKPGRYICIHCKTRVDDLPKFKTNECISAHKHSFISQRAVEKMIKATDLLRGIRK